MADASEWHDKGEQDAAEGRDPDPPGPLLFVSEDELEALQTAYDKGYFHALGQRHGAAGDIFTPSNAWSPFLSEERNRAREEAYRSGFQSAFEQTLANALDGSGGGGGGGGGGGEASSPAGDSGGYSHGSGSGSATSSATGHTTSTAATSDALAVTLARRPSTPFPRAVTWLFNAMLPMLLAAAFLWPVVFPRLSYNGMSSGDEGCDECGPAIRRHIVAAATGARSSNCGTVPNSALTDDPKLGTLFRDGLRSKTFAHRDAAWLKQRPWTSCALATHFGPVTYYRMCSTDDCRAVRLRVLYAPSMKEVLVSFSGAAGGGAANNSTPLSALSLVIEIAEGEGARPKPAPPPNMKELVRLPLQGEQAARLVRAGWLTR